MVISIIALLVAILLPALSAARSQAHRILCASNHRQTNLALHTYAADHDEMLPPTFNHGDGGNVAHRIASRRSDPERPDGLGWLVAGG